MYPIKGLDLLHLNSWLEPGPSSSEKEGLRRRAPMQEISPELGTTAKILDIKGSTVCCIFIDKDGRPDLYGGMTWLKRDDIVTTRNLRVGDLLTVTFDAQHNAHGQVIYKPVFCER
jgi:hypothetical protein